MWTTWVTIHESYGLPRAAYEFRRHLENAGIRVRVSGRSRRSVYVYRLQVPRHELDRATLLLDGYKQKLRGDVNQQPPSGNSDERKY